LRLAAMRMWRFGCNLELEVIRVSWLWEVKGEKIRWRGALTKPLY